MRKEIAQRISQIDVRDAHDAVVLLQDDPALLHLGEDKFLERVQSYVDLAPALRKSVPTSITWTCASTNACTSPCGRPPVEAVKPGLPPRRNCEGRTVARKERYLVGLDVGTSKIAAIVGEMTDDGGSTSSGSGLAESKGIRRGVVVNLEAAVESIKKAIDEAELTAGVEIDSVHLGLSGAHVKAFNSRGVVAVAGKNREITREDVRRAIDAAKAVALPSGREILHVLPQDFVVDEQDGIGAPVGMTGARLEVNVHVVTGSASSTQNIVACVNRAGVAVLDTVLEQLAASEAVLTDDEKELGVALVDIGGGTTDFAIFERGSIVAHRRRRGRRRPLHQRHRGRAAHADSRRGEDQAPLRLRAVGDGRRRRDHGRAERRRAQAARDGAADPVRDPAAARRGDLPPALGRDPARRLREVARTPASSSPAAARCSKAWPRSPSRSSICRSGAACRPASAGWPTTSTARRSRRPSGW